MATSLSNLVFMVTILVATAFFLVANAGDPDISKDFEVPPSLDPGTITGQSFTYTGLRELKKVNFTGRTAPAVAKVDSKVFPALLGQSVSMAVVEFLPGAVNSPHIHPRGTELLLLMSGGSLEVGFVDTTGRLFAQTVRPPDLFVFPKGLVHFQVNVSSTEPAVVLSMFGSTDAGRAELGSELFGSGIGLDILAKAFRTDVKTVSEIVKGF